jgi:hypothetical protein
MDMSTSTDHERVRALVAEATVALRPLGPHGCFAGLHKTGQGPIARLYSRFIEPVKFTTVDEAIAAVHASETARLGAR